MEMMFAAQKTPHKRGPHSPWLTAGLPVADINLPPC